MRSVMARISKLPLAIKILIATGGALLCGVMALSFASIWYQQKHAVDSLTANGARLGDIIVRGVRYSMLLNAREELAEIVKNIGADSDIISIRIFNKNGVIMFSAKPEEVGGVTSIHTEACVGCHTQEPPRRELSVQERTRVIAGPGGQRLLGVLTPVMNEPSCSGPPCHFHPADKAVLGALDVVLPLAASEDEVLNFQRYILVFAGCVFVAGGVSVHGYLRRFLTAPVTALIEGTRSVARGEQPDLSVIRQDDEIGELADSIRFMSKRIGIAQAESLRQRDEYQRLFDQVPCAITVQGKDLRILRYNRQFKEVFKPKPGDFCYSAYKKRSEKCVDCAVEKTLATGLAHCSEESITMPDGKHLHWLVHTSPVFDERGEAVAVMEMTLDITERKELEVQLRRSELKYWAIFNNIPNAVFVLDPDTLNIIDCNNTSEKVYGLAREELLGSSFLNFFLPEERERYNSQLKAFTMLGRARHQTSDGKALYVDIMLSPSEYLGKRVFLLTIQDITDRLETEQKLVQAGKMATLGEMATGVAHELNQPLTVIKTAGSFLLRKVNQQAEISPELLKTMAGEIDRHADRASAIITHMRNFGRRTDLTLEPVRLNEVLKNSTEFFGHQMAHRNIELVWELSDDLPLVMAVPNLLEQVFTNLLLNARDAIEERGGSFPQAPRLITLSTFTEPSLVVARVSDTGAGIPAGVLPRLFEPFFTTKRVGKGTGLGLSISYGIIKSFGGTIGVENRPKADPQGPGAVVSIRLPSAGSK